MNSTINFNKSSSCSSIGCRIGVRKQNGKNTIHEFAVYKQCFILPKAYAVQMDRTLVIFHSSKNHFCQILMIPSP